MVGTLQPLDQKFPIVTPDGRPTLYFIKWAQQKQIDITGSIDSDQATALIAQYLADHQLQAGSGISLTPSGNLTDEPTIAAEVQAILDQISTTQGTVLFRGASDWEALAPGTSGYFLKTNGAGADPEWAAGGGGGGGGNWWFDPPAAADFTLIGTVTPTLTDDTDAGLLVDYGTSATGDVYRGAVKTISTVTADWSVAIKVEHLSRSINYGGVGIILYDTSAARVINFRIEFNSNAVSGIPLIVNRGSYPSGYNSNPFSQDFECKPNLFLRVRHQNSDSKNYYDISQDGKSWINVYSESDTAWLTNRANRVGIGGFYNRTAAAGNQMLMTVPYWAQSGL